MNKLWCLLLTLFFSLGVQAKEKAKVKYKTGKRIDFQSLLIEGEKKKAQFSVVTGNLGEVDLGLLKLRENFHDLMQDNVREVVE
jgi:hypothetical protein